MIWIVTNLLETPFLIAKIPQGVLVKYLFQLEIVTIKIINRVINQEMVKSWVMLNYLQAMKWKTKGEDKVKDKNLNLKDNSRRVLLEMIY